MDSIISILKSIRSRVSGASQKPDGELSSGNPARWWPLPVIILLSLLLIVFIWSSDAPSRQSQAFKTISVSIVTVLALLIWWLFFSRTSLKTRLLVFAVFLLVFASSVGLLRVGGVSGDMVPILTWRWVERSGMNTIVPDTFLHDIDSAPSSSIEDYPQFLGPDRNAVLPGIPISRDWSKRPPRLIWRREIGEGWSAFAVVGNDAVTQEQRGELEMVVCYDLKTGQERWRHSDKTRYETTLAGIGPRATPTIEKNRVYTLGATGILNCLDLRTGRRIWSQDIIESHNAKMNHWGMSGSPLIIDSLVVVSAGGPARRSLVAYHQESGRLVWGGGEDPAGYSSPMITRLAGVPQILIFNRANVASHDPVTGSLLWEHPWPEGVECVAQPVPLPGDRVFVSSGYGIGCKLFQIFRNEKGNLEATLVWETTRLKAKFTNVVHRGGYLYGLDDGVLVCLDLTDGQRAWKRGRYGHGQVILVGDILIVQAESGEIALVEADPNRFKELSRFPALRGKTWNNPALAGSYLLVRNHREAACYELPLDPAPDS